MTSLNEVKILGNLTRDPELKYTPNGTAVATIGIATNRSWKNDKGEKVEDVAYHRIVVWNKLAEICSEYLSKGKKAYFSGRLAYREYTDKDGIKRYVTEIVADNMIMLGGKSDNTQSSQKKASSQSEEEIDVPDDIS